VQERDNGVFYLACMRPHQPFREDDLQFLTVAGSLIGTALHGIEMSRRQRETFLSAIRAVVSVSEMREPEAEGHSARVARLAAAIGRRIPLKERELARLRLAALLHDVGKAAVPARMLEEEGVHDPDHSAEHAKRGEKITASISGSEDLAPSIRHHHESWDGNGFPDGLSGTDIPLFSRVVAAADRIDHIVRDSVTADSVADAKRLLEEESGVKLDPAIVATACEALDEMLRGNSRNGEK